MTARGFSCASQTFDCKALETSLKLIVVGGAPKALNIEVQSGAGGTRIFRFARSAGDTIGRSDVVVWRKPLSQGFSKAKMVRLFAISPRTNSPSLPSIAFQTES